MKIRNKKTFMARLRPLYPYFRRLMKCSPIIESQSQIGFDKHGRIIMTLRVEGQKLPYVMFGCLPEEWEELFSVMSMFSPEEQVMAIIETAVKQGEVIE
ncbi:MAG: hypothetical protein EG824_02065 [Deltaproteobacteria bacterium]|nr:hypothetical protein [Deltaproteobacteria bacterium]